MYYLTIDILPQDFFLEYTKRKYPSEGVENYETMESYYPKLIV